MRHTNKGNIEAHLRNHFLRVKPLNTTHSESLFLA